MADDEIAAGMQLLDQAGDDLALGVGVEIDHHVAQEDDVELAQHGQRLVQVDLQEAVWRLISGAIMKPPSWLRTPFRQYLRR
jgi:hypothetical protein